MAKYYQGLFKPKNPSKYRGDPTNIVYRSRWESVFMSYLDKHDNVVEWGSEEQIVKYRSPIDNKIHRYYPDFTIKKKSKDGKLETVMIEIKPKAQTVPPMVKDKPNRRYLNEVKTWGINSAKWKAAQEFCKNRDWTFQIITEKELGITF